MQEIFWGWGACSDLEGCGKNSKHMLQRGAAGIVVQQNKDPNPGLVVPLARGIAESLIHLTVVLHLSLQTGGNDEMREASW